MTHKDFAHALHHVSKAAGKLHGLCGDMDHNRAVAASGETHAECAKYLADLVVCALHAANTFPGGAVDLEAAVVSRIETKNGFLWTDAGFMPAALTRPKVIDHLDIVTGKEETIRLVREAGKAVSVTRIVVEPSAAPPAPLEPMHVPEPTRAAAVEMAKVQCPQCGGDGRNGNGKTCWRCEGKKVVPDPTLYPDTMPAIEHDGG